MGFFLQGFLWYLLTLLAPLGGLALSRRLFSEAYLAWAMARPLSLASVALVAWYMGFCGMKSWPWVELLLLPGGILMGAPFVRRFWREIGKEELVGLGVFWALALLRAHATLVTGTEKPWDLAVLASLLHSQPLPAKDPWFAGYPLAYYYWGFVPWLGLGKLTGLMPHALYNLLVPSLAALVVQLAFAWARALGLGWRWGLGAAAACVFLGTAQGWGQLFSGAAGFFSTNLWEASRGIAHAITEFPLFTYQLGDLHPHLLCQPWVLASVMSWSLTQGLPRMALTALFFGVAAAANPWSAPPLALVLALQALLLEEGWKSLGSVIAACLGGGALFFPAWGHLPQTTLGLGWVTTPTTFGELCQVLAPILVPLLVVALAKVKPLVSAFGFVIMLVVAAFSQRPLLALAAGLALALVQLSSREPALRAPVAVAVAALGLLGGMELFYIKDPYGPEWYRMNTVFKILSFVFLVLPVPAWRLVATLKKGWVWGFLPWLAAAPQLATALRAAWPLPKDFSGLAWMAAGEAEGAEFLHRVCASDVLVEAVGEAYTDAARISSASGVPTVLGWEHHERLWRSASMGEELTRRRLLVRELYLSLEPKSVQELARKLGASIVVVGSVERELYPQMREEVMLQAGEVIFQKGQLTLIRVAPPPP